MKLAWTILLSLVLTAAACPAFGQSVPEGFRDLKWGATQEQVVQTFPHARCDTNPRELFDWACNISGEKVNDVPIRFLSLHGYTSEKVVGLSGFTLLFNSDGIRQIVDAFESRYGKPSRVEEKEFVTRGGARLPNLHWFWDFPDSTVRIIQNSGKVGDALAIVSLRSASEEFRVRTDARKRGAGKGL
jgi:hypothetical protein